MVKMKQDCKDVPYVVQKDQLVVWHFSLPYDTMEGFMPLAQEQLAAGRLPVDDGEEFLKVTGAPSDSPSQRLMSFWTHRCAI